MPEAIDLTSSWLLMLYGMGGVFVALIVLALIIAGFNVLFGGGARKKDRQDAARAASAPKSHAGVSPEIVAAITAAIAAASGSPAFSIASIRASSQGSDLPVWGRQDRMRKSPR